MILPFSSHFLFILKRESKKRLKKEREKLPEENQGCIKVEKTAQIKLC